MLVTGEDRTVLGTMWYFGSLSLEGFARWTPAASTPVAQLAELVWDLRSR